MGTPWAYNQTFTASYKAPFSRIPVVDFLTGSVTYNATYRWDRGATVDGEKVGNTIANQAAWNFDGRLNLEGLYNKFSYLKKVNQRFSSSKRATPPKKAKRFERTFKLNADTSLVIRHNLRNRKVKVTAATPDGKPFVVRTRVKDVNTIEVLTHGDQNIKFTIVEVLKDDKTIWREIGSMPHDSP